MNDAFSRVREVALLLPEAAERTSQGHPTFFVRDRQFAQLRDHDVVDGHKIVCLRASDADEEAMLIETAPEIYSRCAGPDTGTWVAMNLDGTVVDWSLVEDRVARSWELVAPRGLLEAGGR